jgi:hypothetical protein
MMLSWKIRYLDRADKQFKDRYLYLNTKSLDPTTQAAVELVAENKSSKKEREILKYKHLFTEGTLEGPGDHDNWGRFSSVGPSEYFEDDTGKEISDNEMAQILTGSPTARVMPRGPKHYIDLALSEPKPVPLAEVTLSPNEIRVLGIFMRDLRELQDSAFMKDQPATLHTSGPSVPSGYPFVETAATDDEIRSFVTIFRRLYMEKEPANFQKAAAVFVKSLGSDRYAKFVDGTVKEYERHLDSPPDTPPFIRSGTCTFKVKRLIDVFLYTQYHHQPDEKRQRQFGECLAEVQGKRAILMWLFLTEMWKLSLEIGNAGRIISGWFQHYCDHHAVSPDVPNSLRDHHAGLGAAEKEDDRQARLFQEKVEQLATALWEEAGQPAGGQSQFLVVARDQLSRRING